MNNVNTGWIFDIGSSSLYHCVLHSMLHLTAMCVQNVFLLYTSICLFRLVFGIHYSDLDLTWGWRGWLWGWEYHIFVRNDVLLGNSFQNIVTNHIYMYTVESFKLVEVIVMFLWITKILLQVVYGNK